MAITDRESLSITRRSISDSSVFRGFSGRSEPTKLPDGFPTRLSSKLAWEGSKPIDEADYILTLSDRNIREIERALDHFKGLELAGDLVSRANFPLPRLQYRLESISCELHDGQGFFLIRGIPPDKYTIEDGMIIFLGIQSYIAERKARQDDRGNMVGEKIIFVLCLKSLRPIWDIVHITSDQTDVFTQAGAPHTRKSKASSTFHTEDTGDILAWQTRCMASQGGDCIISSAFAIYNILAKQRPDIIRTLARGDWPFSYPDLHYRPIIYYHSSRLIINFSRAALIGTSSNPRLKNLPSVTSTQLEALIVLEAVAKSKEIKMKTQAGDLQFVNNLAILHRRDDAKHGDGVSKERRHVVMMRLQNQHRAWRLPRELQHAWDDAFSMNVDPIWHLEPMPESYYPLQKYPS